MKKYFLLSILLSLALLLCACSTTKEAENTTTRLVNYSDQTITQALNEFSQEKDKIHQDLQTETNLDAEATKQDINQLKKNISGFDHELDQAVENNKITKEIKQGYDQTIEELKTDLDNLDKELEKK